jgi:hypothetical protein
MDGAPWSTCHATDAQRSKTTLGTKSVAGNRRRSCHLIAIVEQSEVPSSPDSPLRGLDHLQHRDRLDWTHPMPTQSPLRLGQQPAPLVTAPRLRVHPAASATPCATVMPRSRLLLQRGRSTRPTPRPAHPGPRHPEMQRAAGRGQREGKERAAPGLAHHQIRHPRRHRGCRLQFQPHPTRLDPLDPQHRVGEQLGELALPQRPFHRGQGARLRRLSGRGVRRRWCR